jgi:hypothetical protein
MRDESDWREALRHVHFGVRKSWLIAQLELLERESMEDPEKAHAEADSLLVATLHREVADAFWRIKRFYS